MTDLILTEKFSVASDFAKALGGLQKKAGWFEKQGLVITWAVGHLVSLCEPEDYDAAHKRWQLKGLPLIPEQFKYKPIPQGYKQFKIIKELVKRQHYDRVIVATDAGREGEVIARTILLKAGFRDDTRMFRFWTSQALVPAVVRKTLNQLKPASAFDRLWQAGSHRQVADWLIGMNCTRVLTVRLKDLFSVGRVQTAVLALLADRKQARDEFTPEPFWHLKARFDNGQGHWEGIWCKGKEKRIMEAKVALALRDRLAAVQTPGQVTRVETQKKRQPPPLLFSLTDLQQEANKRFGFPAQKTLSLAQTLYQDRKCLSYPRTDARVLGTENLDMVKDILKKLSQAHGKLFTGVVASRVSLSNKRVFNDARLTDHHALIPLKPLGSRGSSDEQKIFDLVLRRFAAAFHGDLVFENTQVITRLDTEDFESSGRVILEKGWQSVWTVMGKNGEGDRPLPPVAVGDSARVMDLRLEEKQTQPPPAYTDSLLLKDMTNPGRYVDEAELKKFFRGDTGLGTQSTRAQIIETLISRKYLQRRGKTLEVTDKGVYLVTLLRTCPVSRVLTSPEETARWEMELNRIALGEVRNSEFLPKMKAFVADAVAELKTLEFQTKPPKTVPKKSKNLGACPACGSPVQEKYKAYDCSGEGCDFVIWKTMARKKISPGMVSHLLRHKQAGPYKGFYSKKRKPFAAGLVLAPNGEGKWQVEFDFARKADGAGKSRAQPKAPRPAVRFELSDPCPLCGGNLIEGHRGVGCSRWRPADGGCLFVIWKTILGKNLTPQNMETLLAGKTTRAYVLRDERGQKFSATLKLVRDRGNRAWIQIRPREAGHEPLEVPCFR